MSKSIATPATSERANALASFKAAYEANPDNVKNTFQFAVHADQLGDEGAALAAYETICANDAAPVSALVNLAVLLEDAGRLAEAERCLRRVLATNPNHGRARLYLKDVRASKAMMIEEPSKDDPNSSLMNTPVTDFDLSLKTKNLLRKVGVRTLGDLTKTTETEIRASRNFGEPSLEEINRLLGNKGLKLGQAAETHSAALREEVLKELDPAAVSTPIGDVDFSVRAKKALQLLGCETLADICMKTEAELMSIKNFGQTSLDEIKIKLTERNLTLRAVEA